MTHPIYIDDVSLEGLRDRLLWLVKGTWPEVGLMFIQAKKPDDLYYPFIWGDQRTSLPVVAALLRTSERSCKTSADDLYKKRKEISRIDDAIKEAYEVEKECKEGLEKVVAALAAELTADQQELLAEKREERSRALSDAIAQRKILDSRRREADAMLKDCESHFARNEVIKFCKSRRYRKNPLNTTNALAGLPFIGCRQSLKRCQKWKCEAGGMTTDLLSVIGRIVESWKAKTALKLHARSWLEQNHRYKPAAQSELRREFYYLRRAIDEVLKTTPRRKFLPYLITSEYQQKVSIRTPVDLLFEGEEQIVMKSKRTEPRIGENSK
jgi:hypothetical protein